MWCVWMEQSNLFRENSTCAFARENEFEFNLPGLELGGKDNCCKFVARRFCLVSFRDGLEPYNSRMPELASHYLDEIRRQMRGYKRLGEGAIAQLDDRQLFVALDPESNSVAILIKHLAGNMHSRFTDLLTTDGEKPDRHRDTEFEISSATT